MSSPAPGRPSPPPEADLIRIAREATGMSPETAAARTTIRLGGSRWRQIEAGYRKDSGQAVIAKARTLAHMAHAVGVSPARLAEAGREDAAEIIREIQHQEAERGQPFADLSDPDERLLWGMNVPEETKRNLIELLRRDKERQRHVS